MTVIASSAGYTPRGTWDNKDRGWRNGRFVVTKIYRTGRREVTALDGVSLRVETGEFVVIRGPSGSGKTTLLMIASSMLDPTSGRVVVDGHDLRQLSPTEKQRFRARHIGFIFQMFHLVPYLNVIENVIFAAGAAAVTHARSRAATLRRSVPKSSSRSSSSRP